MSIENASGRLAVVLSHPTQYYSPWFRHLAAQHLFALKVFYLWDFGVREQRDPGFQTNVRWDVDLLSGYDHVFVENTAADPGTHHFAGLRNPRLVAELREWRPSAVLMFGYKSISHLRVVWWARTSGIPLIFRGDSHFIGRQRPGWLRTTLLRLLYRQFDAVTFVGAANHDYFKVLGVPESRLFFAPHSVDDTLFDPGSPIHIQSGAKLRATLDLGAEARVFLFAGKLVPEKQPRELLEAFLALGRPNTALLFVGEGPEKAELQEKSGARSVSTNRPKIVFLPFANQSEMPSRYLLADVFVLPSRGLYETWGLAVNEAMHMGVPCVVSDRVGCQRDLVTDRETGWVFKCEDKGGLQAALANAMDDIGSTDRLKAIRGSVGKRIGSYTFKQATEGLVAALASVRH